MRFGVGLRPELWAAILEHAATIDVVEVMVDDLLHLSPRRAARELAPLRHAGLDLVVHGVGLSLASVDGPRPRYLRKVSKLLDALKVQVYSEHCSFHRLGSRSVGQFMPVPFTESWAERVATNVKRVQQATGRRLLIENIAYVTESPHQGLGEAGFYRAVCELADCGLLLDLENVCVNAANLAYDALDLVAALPLDQVGQLHLAGGHVGPDGIRVDSHSAPVSADVYALLQAVAPRLPDNCHLIIERDKGFPGSWAPLERDLDASRDCIATGDSTTLQGRRFRAGEERRADDVSARQLQEAWIDYFQMDRDRRPQPYVAAVPERFRAAFGSVLRTKRRDKLKPLLPGTWRYLVAHELLDDTLRRWFTAQPDQSLSRAAEVMGFANLVQASADIPEAIQALARHEATLVELKSKPYRRWPHRWLPQRREIVSSFSGRALDEASRGGELPEALTRSARTRYTRRAKGVWVQDL